MAAALTGSSGDTYEHSRRFQFCHSVGSADSALARIEREQLVDEVRQPCGQ